MIIVTDTAKQQIKQLLKRRGKGVGIRLGVKTTGCSGLAYTLEYVDEYIAEIGVTNYAHDNFALQPSSPAFSIGFKQIDFSTVGPRS